MSHVHVVLPAGVDDPDRPSGGNVYDRRLCTALPDAGWTVNEHLVEGTWPAAESSAHDALAAAVGGVKDGTAVLVDGLIASAAPDVLVPAAEHVRLVVLVHLPVGYDPRCDPSIAAGERAVLSVAHAVVATSSWTREWLLDRYGLRPESVYVARPGAVNSPLIAGTDAGTHLVCVGAVAAPKGQDVLVAALTRLAALAWRCTFVGPRSEPFTSSLREHIAAAGIQDRVQFVGARTGAELERCYGTADVVVLPTRAETYGMVVTEALAHGLPVIASHVGGVPEAVGRTRDGQRPGLLVPPDDPSALAGAIRAWLEHLSLRRRLRATAAARRPDLASWSDTAADVARALSRALAG